MSTVIMLLCTVAGYTLAQPVIKAVRNAQAARARQAKFTALSHAHALRALRSAKGL